MADSKVTRKGKVQSYVKPAIICERDVEVFAATCNSSYSGHVGCRLSGSCLLAFS